jgi:drug/metabolite transporter (DMT)-like permease
LALLCAASWGAADFAGGITTRLSNNVSAVLLGQGVGLLLAAMLLIPAEEALPSSEAVAWALIAGASGVFGLAFFYLALSRGTMGLVAPLTALLAAVIPAVAGLWRGDDPGTLELVGMLTALAAIVLISLPDRRLGGPTLATFHGSRAREGLLILLAACGFAGFFLCLDAARAAGGETWWPLFLVKVGGVGCMGLLAVGALLIGRRLAVRVGRAALMTGAAAGIADFAGNLFFVLASRDAELSVVVVLSSLYPIGTALLARLLLHERLGPARLAGVGLAVAGVVLIGLGSM